MGETDKRVSEFRIQFLSYENQKIATRRDNSRRPVQTAHSTVHMCVRICVNFHFVGLCGAVRTMRADAQKVRCSPHNTIHVQFL